MAVGPASGGFNEISEATAIVRGVPSHITAQISLALPYLCLRPEPIGSRAIDGRSRAGHVADQSGAAVAGRRRSR